MVCVKRRRANVRFSTAAADQWMGLCPRPRGRGWVKRNCVSRLEVCVWRRDACTACAELRDIVASS